MNEINMKHGGSLKLIDSGVKLRSFNSSNFEGLLMSEHVGSFAKINIDNEFPVDTVFVVSFDKDDTDKLLVMFVEDIYAQHGFMTISGGVNSSGDFSPMFFINKSDLLFLN